MTKKQLKRAELIASKGMTFYQKTWFCIRLVLYGLIVICIINTGLQINKYITTHTFIPQSPVILKWQSPVRILDNEKVIKKQAKLINVPKDEPLKPIREYTEKEIVMKYKRGVILWNLYFLESTHGKNDYCRKNGLGYGGYGVMYQGKIMCYKSFEEATKRADYWLNKMWDNESLARTTCMWNLGKPLDDCPYYQTFRTLL